MGEYGVNGWTQDELDSLWDRLHSNPSQVHKILQDDKLRQSMSIHAPQVASYGHDEDSRSINIEIFRLWNQQKLDWDEWVW